MDRRSLKVLYLVLVQSYKANAFARFVEMFSCIEPVVYIDSHHLVDLAVVILNKIELKRDNILCTITHPNYNNSFKDTFLI